MLNNRPIFLNCFSRGGSNIFWNIFLSHPEVCSPIEETLQIFRLDLTAPRWAGVAAAVLSGQPRLFDQWWLEPRRSLSPAAQWFIDQELYRWKLKTLDDVEMRYKSQEENYTETEVAQARLCAKNNNGLTFLTEQFLQIYPDAVFFGLVREPLALYESHKRRRTPPSASPEQFAAFYNALVNKMQADVQRWPGQAFLARFEDLLANPAAEGRQLYGLAGLDPDRAPRLRFKAKPHLHADGTHRADFAEGKHYWFAPEEAHQILEMEINAFQASRVPPEEREKVMAMTAETRKAIGY